MGELRDVGGGNFRLSAMVEERGEECESGSWFGECCGSVGSIIVLLLLPLLGSSLNKSNTQRPRRAIKEFMKMAVIFMKRIYCFLLAQDNTVEFGLEPVHRVLLGNQMLGTYLSSGMATLADTLTWTAKNNVEISTINTDAWVIFDTQINVFLNTETKVTTIAKVL